MCGGYGVHEASVALSVLGLIVRSPLIRRCLYSRPADRSRYDLGTLLERSVRPNTGMDDLDDEERICPQSFYDCEVGTVLALEDRNSLAQDWPGRRVFVVRGNTSACVFDCNFRQDHR